MKNAASKSKQDKTAAADPYRSITTEYLQDWAGRAVFNRGLAYRRQGCVQLLQRTAEGGIVAWVQGTRRYAVLLDATGAGQLDSVCTCPYADRCKHAVAAILEYQRMLLDGEAIAIASDSDARIALIDASLEGDDEGDPYDEVDEEDPYDEDDEPCDEDASATRVPEHARAPSKRGTARNRLAPWLDELTKTELLTLVRDVLRRDPDLLYGFESAHALRHLPRSSAMKSLEREIERVTSETAWWNGWEHTGHIPDYSGICAGLRALLKQGCADDIVRLGDRMLQRMNRQIESSDDDGMLSSEMTGALEPVFDALKASSLTPVEKMLKAHQWRSDDEYGLCEGLAAFWSQRFPRKTWSEFADILLKRLEADGTKKDGAVTLSRYRRDQLGNVIIDALEKAGRDADALALCEREAPGTQNFGRLVDRLMARRRYDEAEKWIRDGVAMTCATTPGIASGLRRRFRELRAAQLDWPFVAALQAEEFYASLSMQTWKEMRVSCEKAGVWSKVRSLALAFLNTGASLRTSDRAWPLPKTGLPDTPRHSSGGFPRHALLLEIALDENDLSEVMRLYDRFTAAATGLLSPRLPDNLLDRVATALQSMHPDVAVSIWNGIALQHIAMTKPFEYDVAVRHLAKTKKLLHALKRDTEWRAFYGALITKEKRKRRFIQSANETLGPPP